MKQNYFEDLDTGWDDLISNVYNDKYVFKPEYEIIDGKKCILKQYTNADIVGKKELILDNDLYKIYDYCFTKCRNLVGKLIIPDSVEYISSDSFAYCSGFTSIKLSNNLKEIDTYAFYDCHNLTGELIIPDSVEFICSGAFSLCSGFTSIKLSNNLKEIGVNSFNKCYGITGELIIPESTVYINDYAFTNCNFSKIYVPKKHVNNYGDEWNVECNAKIIEY